MWVCGLHLGPDVFILATEAVSEPTGIPTYAVKIICYLGSFVDPALAPCDVIEATWIIVGHVLQHDTLFECAVVIFASEVIAFVMDHHRDVFHYVQHPGHLAGPCIIDLMWAKMSGDFNPLAGQDGEYSIGMFMIGLDRKSTRLNSSH